MELYSIQIFVRGGKIEQTENERAKKEFFPSLLLAANECHGIMANVRVQGKSFLQLAIRAS